MMRILLGMQDMLQAPSVSNCHHLLFSPSTPAHSHKEGGYDRVEQAYDREEDKFRRSEQDARNDFRRNEQNFEDDWRQGEQNAEATFRQNEQDFEGRVHRDEQAVEDMPGNAARWAEQGVENTMQGIGNIPSDIEGGIDRVAGWIGEKVGGVERESRDAEQDVDRWGENVRDDYRDGKQDVDRFGDRVEGSYDQGENQGRRDGW